MKGQLYENMRKENLCLLTFEQDKPARLTIRVLLVIVSDCQAQVEQNKY